MDNEQFLRIAVVSDLHCIHKSNDTASGITFLYSNLSMHPIARHPVYSLLNLLENDDSIRANLIICPGDISDKADEQGIISGWDYLKKIQAGLNAKHLLATVGNHDVDSHRKHPYTNSFQLLQSFSNDYPILDKINNYWSEKFALIEDDDYQILVINTCHNHFCKDDTNQSIIDPKTLEEINITLNNLKPKKYRFAFCHHHPVKHSNIDIQYRDGDVIDNGDILLQLLNKYDFQLIIHGHKHDPRLKMENNLTVFAAGSFSSLMNIKELGADNCFHIIDLYPFEKKGIIRSWIYAPTRGWEIRHDREFPCFTGFGSTTSVENIAENCSKYFIEEKKEIINYTNIKSKFPDISYLIPDDQKKLSQIFKIKYGLSFVPDLPNIPKFLTKVIYD